MTYIILRIGEIVYHRKCDEFGRIQRHGFDQVEETQACSFITKARVSFLSTFKPSYRFFKGEAT